MPALFVCSPQRHRGTEKSGGESLQTLKALRMTRVESRCGDRGPSTSLRSAQDDSLSAWDNPLHVSSQEFLDCYRSAGWFVA
jgi:hypothetical protein